MSQVLDYFSNIINAGKLSVVHMILGYMNKYFRYTTAEDTKLALLRGNCTFDVLELNVKAVEHEFDVPLQVISGHINGLTIDVPWYKLLKNVTITVDTLELVVTLKNAHENKTEKISNTEADDQFVSNLSSYSTKVITKIIENLSLRFNHITVKYLDDDIVFNTFIKSFNLCRCNDDWAINTTERLLPTQWLMKKTGGTNALTLSINKVTESGMVEQFLEPLVFQNKLDIRMCCVFEQSFSIMPFVIQLDVFSPEIVINFTEAHLKFIAKLLSTFQSYSPDYRKPEKTEKTDINLKPEVYDKSLENRTNKGWADWMKTWIYNTSNITTIDDQIFKIGLYINTFQIIPKIETGKVLRSYRPLMKISFDGLMAEMIKIDPSSLLDIKFGVSKTTIDSESDCTCTLQDCYNEPHMLSGKELDEYLAHSLFKRVSGIENTVYSLDDDFEDNSILKRTPSFGFDYVCRENEISTLTFEAGPCVINITSGLVHRMQFVHNIIMRDFNWLADDSLTAEVNTSAEELSKTNDDALKKQITLKIINWTLKVFPVCHVELKLLQNCENEKRLTALFANPPMAMVRFEEIYGNFTSSDSCSTTTPVTSQNCKTPLKDENNIRVMNLEAIINKFHNDYTLLHVNDILLNNTKECDLASTCAYHLDVDEIKFSSSKEDTLLFYYIVQSMFTLDDLRQLYNTNCIFNSTLLDEIPITSVLNLSLRGFVLQNVSTKRNYNTKITLKSITVELIKIDKMMANDFLKTVVFSYEHIDRNIMEAMLLNTTSDSVNSKVSIFYMKTQQLEINFDPLIFEWISFVPKLVNTKIQSTSAYIHYRAPEYILFHSKEKNRDSRNKSESLKVENRSNNMEINIMFADIAAVNFYFPNKTLLVKKSKMKNTLNAKEWIKAQSAFDVDIFVLSMTAITMDSGMKRKIIENYFQHFPINNLNDTTNFEREAYFPWMLKLDELECYTYNTYTDTNKITILEPFSVSCNLYIKETNSDNDSSENDCKISGVHLSCKLEPINIFISEKDNVMICDLLVKCTDVYLAIFSNIQYKYIISKIFCDYNIGVIEKKSSSTVVDNNQTNFEHSSSFVCTLQSFSMTLWNRSGISPNRVKLVLNLGKMALSRQTTDTRSPYKRTLFSMRSASIRHLKKNANESVWAQGSYSGVMLQVLSPSTEPDSKEFLSISWTRTSRETFQMNYRSVYSVTEAMSVNDDYLMQLSVNMLPLEIIISPIILNNFLNILEPIVQALVYFKTKTTRHSLEQTVDGLDGNTKSTSSEPVQLFDINVDLVRILFPVDQEDDGTENVSTVVVQVNSIDVNTYPDNPIARTPPNEYVMNIEREIDDLLNDPGRSARDSQCQLMINDFSIKIDSWSNVVAQSMEKDQISYSQTEIRDEGAFECDSMSSILTVNNSVSTRNSSVSTENNASALLNNVSISCVYAPAIVAKPDNRLICGKHLVMNIVNEIIIKMSTGQLSVLMVLFSQIDNYIISHIKDNELLKNDSHPKQTISNRFSASNKCIMSLMNNHQDGTNEIPMDIIITGNDISIYLYNCTIIDQSKIEFKPLLYCCIDQPNCVLLFTKQIQSFEIIILDLFVATSPRETRFENTFPEAEVYSIQLFGTKLYDQTEECIPDFFKFKITSSSDSDLQEIDIILNRKISITIHKSSAELLNDLLRIMMVDSNLIRNADVHSNKNEPSTSSELCDEVFNKNALPEYNLEEPEDIMNEFKHSSVTMNVNCQQAVMTVFADNNEDNVVLCVGSVCFKLITWSENSMDHMTGTLSLCGVTISTGYSVTHEFLLYPLTLAVNIRVYSLDSERLTKTNQLQVETEYLSVDLSQNRCRVISQIWNTYCDFLPKTEKKNDAHLRAKQQSVVEKHYVDDFQTNGFVAVTLNDTDLLQPKHSITFLDDKPANSQFVMTWKYPQPRMLTTVVLRPMPICFSHDVTVFLKWYDEITNQFKQCAGFSFSKKEPVTLSRENEREVSNTWCLVIDCEDSHLITQKLIRQSVQIHSFFSTRFVPRLKLSADVSTIKINIVCNAQTDYSMFTQRFQCVSKTIPEHPLVYIGLESGRVSFQYLEDNVVNASAEANLKIEVLVYENTMQTTVLKLFFEFACYHTEIQRKDSHYSLRTGPILVELGPSTINSLYKAWQLWNNISYDISPYVVCNDTYFDILFGQTNTDEAIVLESLQCFHYTWNTSTKAFLMRFTVGNDGTKLFWSEAIAVDNDISKALSFKTSNGASKVLWVNVIRASPVLTKIIIRSTLNLVNETMYSLSVRISRQNLRDDKEEDIFSVLPANFSSSIMINGATEISMALRHSQTENQWSDTICLYGEHRNTEDYSSARVKIADKEDPNQYQSVWCTLIVENSNEVVRMLILILPMYVIRSYLPFDTEVSVSSTNFDGQFSVKVASALKGTSAQPVDLPEILTDDRTSLTVALNKKRFSDVNIPSYPNDEEHNENDSNHEQETSRLSIEDILNGKHLKTSSDLKWPYVGHQFNNVQWKQGLVVNTKATVKIEPYDYIDHDGLSTKSIEVKPWALIVNTTGHKIGLFLKITPPETLCTLDNMSVVAPSEIKENFYVVINEEIDYHSVPLNMISEKLSHNLEGHSIPLEGHLTVFMKYHKSIGFFDICSSNFEGMRIVHIQSVYVATNHSSKDADILTVCSMPSSDLYDIPLNIDQLTVTLPKSQGFLSKPLTMWALTDTLVSGVILEKLNWYIAMVFQGYVSCPIKLSDIPGNEFPLPVSFCTPGEFNPLLSVSLTVHDGQHVLTVHDQSHPQLIISNFCHTTILITKNMESETFSEDWKWSYKIRPEDNGYLSFTAMNNPQTLYATRLSGNSINDRLASITLENSDHTLTATSSDNKIDVTVSKNAFTWNVSFQPVAPLEHSTELLSTTSKRTWPTIDYRSQCFIITLFENEIYSKAIFTATLENLAVGIKSNTNCENEIDLIISVYNIQIDNRQYLKGNYNFPTIIKTQRKDSQRLLDEPTNTVVNEQRADIDLALNIKIIMTETKLLDVEVSVATLVVCIEDRFCYSLMEHIKRFRLFPFDDSAQDDIVPEMFLPLHFKAYPQAAHSQLMFRNLTIKPFALEMSLRWKAMCHVSFNRLQLGFLQFKKLNMKASQKQLISCMLIHYYTTLIKNVGQVLSSVELFGATRNLANTIQEGLNDFLNFTANGATRGYLGLIYGFAEGSKSLITKVTCGLLLSIFGFTSSWSQMFNEFKSFRNISIVIAKCLETMAVLSKLCLRSIQQNTTSTLQYGQIKKIFGISKLRFRLLLNLSPDDKILATCNMVTAIYDNTDKVQNLTVVLTKNHLYLYNEQLEQVIKRIPRYAMTFKSEQNVRSITLYSKNNDASIVHDTNQTNTVKSPEVTEQVIVLIVDPKVHNHLKQIIESDIYQANNFE